MYLKSNIKNNSSLKLIKLIYVTYFYYYIWTFFNYIFTLVLYTCFIIIIINFLYTLDDVCWR